MYLDTPIPKDLAVSLNRPRIRNSDIDLGAGQALDTSMGEMGAHENPWHHRECLSSWPPEYLDVHSSVCKNCFRRNVHPATEELAIGDNYIDGVSIERVMVDANRHCCVGESPQSNPKRRCVSR